MIYFIVNPTSGTGTGKKIWNRIQNDLKTRFSDILYQVYFSEYTGHLHEIFQSLKQKNDIEKIVSVGGDGTFNETVNGLCLLGNIPVVCLPGGTSNDFARSLQLPSDISTGLAFAMQNNESREIDSCRASSGTFSRLFVNGLGFGYDGQIISYTERSWVKPFLNKIGINKLMYIIYGVRQAFACKRFSVKIEHDDTITEIDHCYMVTAMLNPFQGGGIYFAPSADSSDGLTDLVCIHSKNRLRFIYHVVRALLKLPAKGEGYTVIRFTNAHIQFETPQIGQIDGEFIGAYKEMNFTSLPKQFRLIPKV